MKKESSIEVGWEGVQGILLPRAAGLLLTDKIRKVDLTDKCFLFEVHNSHCKF